MEALMGVLVPSFETIQQSRGGRHRRWVRLLGAIGARLCRSLWLQCLALAAGFWIYHLWLSAQMQRGGLRLGAVSHKLAPLYAYFDPRIKGGLLLALAVLFGYGLFLRRWLRAAPPLRDWKAVAVLTALLPLSAIAVAGIDGNLTRIARPFERTDIEYFGAVGRVGELATFIGTYPQRAVAMPMHAQTHPPGAVLFLWTATRFAGESPLHAALAAIFFSALSVPAVYLFARDLGGEALARLSTALYLLMPNVVLFTATSLDGPFAVFLIWSIYLGWRAIERCCAATGLAAGLVLAVAAWMTFSASVVGLFLVLVAVLSGWRRARHEGTPVRHVVRSGAIPLLAMLTGCLAFYLPLYASTGYHPADMLGTAMCISGRLMGNTGHTNWPQHWHIAAANVAVFFFFCGLPVAVLWLRQTLHLFRTGWSRTTWGTVVVAFVAALAITDLLPLYSLETERIWIFLAPLIVIPAAARVLRQMRLLPGTVLLLAGQAVVTELLLCTYW
jgi:hypothetical protein